jgi:hypothetical protein
MYTGAAPLPSEPLERLNLLRGTDGSWKLDDDLMATLAPGGGPAADRIAAGRPQGLSDGQWATVLALAYLRRAAACWHSPEG